MPPAKRRTTNVIAAQRSHNDGRPSINPLKKRIRDVRRLLGKNHGLPANKREELERELASCQHEVQRAERKVRRSRIIKKYHMIRFFERKIATKQLKRARKALNEAEDLEKKKIAAQTVHEREVDLNYTLHYPLHLTYSSLWPKSKNEVAQIDLSKPRRDHTMWTVVEEAMKTGQLQALRDGKLEGYREDEVTSVATSSRTDGKQKKSSHEDNANTGGRASEDEMSDDEDDGKGFFE